MGEIQRTSGFLSVKLLVAIIAGGIVGILMGLAFYFDWLYLLAIPILLAVLYVAIYHIDFLFQSIVFFTPLSVNIEEYTDQFGLFLPTEPLLFGIMLLLVYYQLKAPIIDLGFFKHPLILMLIGYLAWLVISSITSTHPLVSFKSLLSRLWFIIPILFFGPVLLTKRGSIPRFFLLLTIGTVLVIVYTLLNHASYGFGEKESHWVMSPFYKDHTIYGAAVALVFPFPLMLFLMKKQTPLSTLILGLLFLIIVLGLYFSYTRAAWLSVFGALVVLVLVFFKVRFTYVLVLVMFAFGVLLWKQDSIQMELARNKSYHIRKGQFIQNRHLIHNYCHPYLEIG